MEPIQSVVASQPRGKTYDLLQRGGELMGRGDLPAARLFYQRAAEAGLGEAALALAATFDPEELSRNKVQGAVPDIDEATRWYRRARDLGMAEAKDRLDRLRAR